MNPKDPKKESVLSQALDMILPILLIFAILDLIGSCSQYMDDVASQDSHDSIMETQ